MVHRRILDIARANPETPIEALAPIVSGATPDMIRHVFEEYGDPCDEAVQTTTDSTPSDHSTATSTSTSATSTENATSDPEGGRSAVVGGESSEEQLRTLRAVYDHPSASQRHSPRYWT